MSNNNDQLLEKRIEHLEQLVKKLLGRVEHLEEKRDSEEPSPGSTSPPLKPEQAHRKPATDNGMVNHSAASEHPADKNDSSGVLGHTSLRKRRPMYSLNSEEWLNRIGLSLLFLGVGLALKYTFDQIWFTALLRVMSGSFVGLLLLAVGLHFYRSKPRFGQLLLSVGVATFYLTAFGAYQLYHLIPYKLAFVILFIITSLSFALSAQRDDVLLAILATLGGLATPFVMHSEGDNLLWLISYTSLILIGAGSMYWFRGWRSLLFISSIGAWLVILFCYLNFGLRFESIASERWTVQAGLLIALGLFWVMPVVRGLLRSANPDKWPAPPPVKAVGYFFNHPALPLSVLTPLSCLGLSIFIWDLSDKLWGWIILLSSAVFFFIYFFIRRKYRVKGLNHLAQMQGFTACILATIGIFYLLDTYFLLAGLAVEALAIRIIARKMNDKLFSFASSTAFLALTIWVAKRLIDITPSGIPLLNTPALCELAVIVLCILSTSFINQKWLSRTYLIINHLLILGLVFREFYPIQDGQAVITMTWGIYGVALFLYGLWKDHKPVRFAGIYTLVLVAVKLLLVDLEEVDPLIRILLFVGFGVIFMLLSYLLSIVFKKRPGDNQPPIRYSRNSPERAMSE